MALLALIFMQHMMYCSVLLTIGKASASDSVTVLRLPVICMQTSFEKSCRLVYTRPTQVHVLVLIEYSNFGISNALPLCDRSSRPMFATVVLVTTYKYYGEVAIKL